MAITRTQIARQLLALGGPVDAVNQLLGIEGLMAGGINRPTGGYEIKSGMPRSKENIDKGYESIFDELPKDMQDMLRDNQMKDIAGQTSMVPLGTIISGAKGILGGKGGAAVMKKMGKDLATQRAIEKMMRQKLEKEMAEKAAAAQTRRISIRNQIDNTGGYQAGYSDDFMSGSGTSKDMGSS